MPDLRTLLKGALGAALSLLAASILVSATTGHGRARPSLGPLATTVPSAPGDGVTPPATDAPEPDDSSTLAPDGDPGGGGDPPVALHPPVRCPSKGSPRTGELAGPDQRDGRQWVTVGSLEGSCDAASGVLHLQGVDTRLVYRSDGGDLTVVVVDPSQATRPTTAPADAKCSTPCSETAPIDRRAGDYVVRVQAGDAPWQVLVQEYR